MLQNAITDSYRRRAGRRAHLPSTVGADVEEEVAPSPEVEAVLWECFRPLVPTLKPEYGELIEALDLGDETPEKAAQRLRITPTT